MQVHNYIGLPLEEAVKKAEQRTFDIIVNDSIFVLGKEPNEVISQSPAPRSRVKENRKIYLTISRANPDLLRLPDLTGGNDDFKQYERKLKQMKIRTKVAGRKFSNKLEPNTILQVIFRGDTITNDLKAGYDVPMGSVVEFIVTERGAEYVQMPNLMCKTYDEATFILSNYNLNVGSIIEDEDITNRSISYVYQQTPAYRPGKTLKIGEFVDLYVSQARPTNCADGFNDNTPVEIDGNIEEGDGF